LNNHCISFAFDENLEFCDFFTVFCWNRCTEPSN